MQDFFHREPKNEQVMLQNDLQPFSNSISMISVLVLNLCACFILFFIIKYHYQHIRGLYGLMPWHLQYHGDVLKSWPAYLCWLFKIIGPLQWTNQFNIYVNFTTNINQFSSFCLVPQTAIQFFFILNPLPTVLQATSPNDPKTEVLSS